MAITLLHVRARSATCRSSGAARAVRMKNANEGFFVALFELVSRAKRRYGGYIVHLGLVAMYFGFTGAAYDKDKEAALRPGESARGRRASPCATTGRAWRSIPASA